MKGNVTQHSSAGLRWSLYTCLLLLASLATAAAQCALTVQCLVRGRMQLAWHAAPPMLLTLVVRVQVAMAQQLNANFSQLLAASAGVARYEAMTGIMNQALNTSCPNSTQLRVSRAAAPPTAPRCTN